MKVVKLALLGTAALAAVSVSARADDLADLKAQIEALNGRITQLESTPSIPAGYQLLSVSKADAIIVPGYLNDKEYGNKATNIGILPTADVPASTNIQWSGFVRAGLTYANDDYSPTVANAATYPDDEAIDIKTRAGIKVVGTTDTAVGEVGVRIALLASVETTGGINRSHDAAVATDGYWGWWKITPELTFAGGVDGSLANSSNLYDNRCFCAYNSTGGAFGNGDPSQFRLSYDSGPISLAIAVEDYDHDQNPANGGPFIAFGAAGSNYDDSSLGVAGEFKWSGDSFGFDLNAGYWDTAGNGDADWTVNAGANFALGDIASVGIAAGVGEGIGFGGLRHNANDDFFLAGAYLGFNLSEATKAELGVTYLDHDLLEQFTVSAGLYYTPVAQLTLGLEASYQDTSVNGQGETAPYNLSDAESVRAALLSVWRF